MKNRSPSHCWKWTLRVAIARSPALAEVRAQRDPGGVGQALDRLRVACQGTENTMPYILDAVRVYASLGEIMGVMKEVFGIYQEPNWI